MGFKRQEALIKSRLQDRVDTPNDFTILDWTSRRSNDKNPPDEPLRCDLYQILDETSIKTIKTIRRRLKAMDKAGIIRYSESAKRYGYICDIVIIDPDYIDALTRIQSNTHARRNGRQVSDTLVTGHDDHSQQATDTLVTGHRDHSQKHQDTNAGPQIAGSGHRDHSNGHGDHSHSKKKEGKDHRREGRKQDYLNKINDHLDPSFLPLQEAPELKPNAENLIREMLKHPEICIDPDYITPLTRAYGPGRIFFACCHYLDDRRRGTIDGPGALIHRLANPDQFPTPAHDIYESYAACFGNIGNSRFYTDFEDKIRDYRDKIDRLKWEREESEVIFCNDNHQTPNTNGTTPPITDRTPTSPTNGADRIWSDTLRELKLILPAATFTEHLRGTTALHYQGGRLTIKALNVYSQNMLRDRLRSKIEDVLKQMTGHPVQAYFTSPDQLGPETATPQDTAGTAALSQPPEGRHSDDNLVGPAPNDSLQPAPEPPAPQDATGAQNDNQVDPPPEPEPNPLAEQLRSLLDQLDASDANAITRDVNREIHQIRTKALPADEERDHIDQLFTHRINTLENDHPKITAGTRESRPAPSCGDSDTDQITGDDQRDHAPCPEPATHMQDENIEYRKVEMNRRDHKLPAINFIPAQPGLQANAAQATRTN